MLAHHVFVLATRLVLIGVVALACTGCSADRVLLYPQCQPATSVHGQRREVPGPAGSRLEVFVARTAACAGREPDAFVLDLCGNGDRAEWSVDRTVETW